jgi:hydrogenase expression/formation protein HypC
MTMCLGIPGQIVAIHDAAKKLGVIEVGSVRRIASVIMVQEPDQPLDELIGAWVLVHVGFAMSRIDEAEARRTLALLHEMGELMEQTRELGDRS